MQGFLNEFKAFAMKGNVVDLAVGVVIGGAFGTIVSSLVADIIMPVIGVATGGANFSGLTLKVGDAVITYGRFIQAVFVFAIVAFALFMVIKTMNTLKRKEEAAPHTPAEDIVLLREIRDALKSR